LIVLDRKSGDIICTSCGAVACESIVHEGSQFRKFEGEVDRNHHGDVRNPLFSDSYNMSTGLGGSVFQTPGGARVGSGRGPSCNQLRKTHRLVELNISNMMCDKIAAGKKSINSTRKGYKDQQKREAFAGMKHVGDALDLNVAMIEKAKEMYSQFRDDRDVLKDRDEVIAACMIEAFDQYSTEGKNMLSELQKNQAIAFFHQGSTSVTKSLRRAMKRSTMHTHNMANSFSNLASKEAHNKTHTSKVNVLSTAVESKALSLWDISDVRSWLVHASQDILEQWQSQDNHQKSGQLSSIAPHLSSKEATAIMAESVFLLCEFVETGSKNTTNQKKRSPGQAMLLLTEKRMCSILGHSFAACALHQKLRALATRQGAFREKQARKKASQIRMKQIKNRHLHGYRAN